MSEFLYNIGDTVEIVDNIEYYAYMEYNGEKELYELKKDVAPSMAKYAGKTAIVNSRSSGNYIGYRINLDSGYFKWHQDLLRPVQKRDSIEEML